MKYRVNLLVSSFEIEDTFFYTTVGVELLSSKDHFDLNKALNLSLNKASDLSLNRASDLLQRVSKSNFKVCSK